jgi:lipopolysaccharide/colanic/teichoic acid biosynthesis glycosyltransferase
LLGHFSGHTTLAKVNHRLQRPASRTQLLSRVGIFDAAWGGASPLLAFILRDGTINSPNGVATYCAIALVASLLVFQWFRTSSPIFRYFSVADALELLKACILIAALSAALAFLFTRLDEAPRSIPILHFFLLASGLLAARLIWRLHQAQREVGAWEAKNSVQHVLVIQASRLAWFFSKLIEELVPGKYQIVAILDERPMLQLRSLNRYPIVGPPEQIEKVVDEYTMHGVSIDKVIVAATPEEISKEAWEHVSRVCRDRQIELDVLSDLLISEVIRVREDGPPEIFAAGSIPADVGNLEALLARPFWKIKRVIDLVVASTTAVLMLPVFVATFGLALLDVGIPVIFWQRRVGRDGAPLYLYKFRTLQTLYDRHTKERRESHSPSAIGQFLRNARFDELPQLWNVLSGDMSLIGPRPLLPVDQPTGASIRLTVRPGLSGWAQVCGGKRISCEEKNALDEWYIRHASFYLDARIVLRTILMLLVGDRRDERAIATALAERYRGDLAKLLSTVSTQRTERRGAFGERLKPGRVAEAAGLKANDRTVPTKPVVDASVRSVAAR